MALTGKDTVVLADFTNKTSDPVFDGTLSQGLVVQLGQSPFLSIVSDEQIQQTLRLMGWLLFEPGRRGVSGWPHRAAERLSQIWKGKRFFCSDDVLYPPATRKEVRQAHISRQDHSR